MKKLKLRKVNLLALSHSVNGSASIRFLSLSTTESLWGNCYKHTKIIIYSRVKCISGTRRIQKEVENKLRQGNPESQHGGDGN